MLFVCILGECVYLSRESVGCGKRLVGLFCLPDVCVGEGSNVYELLWCLKVEWVCFWWCVGCVLVRF